MQLIVAMTGATGAIHGIRLLERLQEREDVQTHLVMSKWARLNIVTETDYVPAQVEALADVVYNEGDQSAAISSGSFRVDAMVVIPCSMRTLAAIRHGVADNLIGRAADVVLKEGRKLCLMPRETPLNQIHLDNMLALARMGASICPPMPAFYNRPESLDDVVDHIAVRILDQLGLDVTYDRRWRGLTDARAINNTRNNGESPQMPDLQPTLMWEAAATADSRDQLHRWVKEILHESIRDVDPDVVFDLYRSDDARVVAIASGKLDGFQPPQPPDALVRRAPHVWHFVRDLSRPSDQRRGGRPA